MKKKYSFSIAWIVFFAGGLFCRSLDGIELEFADNYFLCVIPLVVWFFLGQCWDEMERL